jgi:hypothetical protein
MQIVTNLTFDNLINKSKNASYIPLEEIKQTIDLTHLILSFILSLFCIITVCGNILVIYAVIQERYLKSGRVNYQILDLVDEVLLRKVSEIRRRL